VSKQNSFEANIDWGSVSEDVDLEKLPAEFSLAKELWSKKQVEKACELISPFLSCNFIPDNGDGDLSEIFQIQDEVSAAVITVTGVDFSESNVPKVRAIAKFQLPSKKKLTSEKISEWEEENSMLDNCIAFEWGGLKSIDDDFAELDLALFNHEGLSFTLVS
jgi:hypothetical protein